MGPEFEPQRDHFFLKTIYMLCDSVAQLVEQYTFNVWVLSSSLSGITRAFELQTLFFYV
jgi:hypothetical protein